MKTPTVITGRMVLYGMVGFFAVIFAVNGAFVYFALNSWPGLSSDNAYEDGRNYNQTLADAAVQNALGWKSDVAISPDQDHYVVRVDLTGTNGESLAGQRVRATFQRPVGEEYVIAAELLPTDRGVYLGRTQLPLTGRWQVLIEAGINDEISYRMLHEVTVRE